ncbi:Cloroperoxidase [Cadophora sp. DSE1049]|nr:Cloroperoxidase [Cadophora sp. DSE1049]
MKQSHLSYVGATLLSILAPEVAAFPGVLEAATRAKADRHIVGRQEAPDLNPTFNERLQHVSTTGEHAFVAPNLAAGDQRGPCPGLNAMANHGYLPHNGVGSHTDFIKGTFDVFGMSADLSGFLTVLGGTIDGDGLTWSIGGPSKANSAIGLGGLLGIPQGLSGSHNKYESDASPGRGDLYLDGNDFTLQMDQYQQLYDAGQANGDNYDLPLLTDFRSQRFDHSAQNNPYFFNGPFTGVLVQPAAYTFIYRFMSNKSAEYPAGRLNGDRIPDNWYKRAVGDEYSIPFLQADTLLAAAKYPKFLNVGGNTGTPNTFTGVNAEDLTGGVYNTRTLTEGNNLACFAMQFAVQASPDIIQCSGVLNGVTSAMQRLTSQAATSLSALSCPQLTKIDDDQFKQFPGYANLDCKTGTY